MPGLKKGFAAALVVALLVVGGAGSALANSFWPTYVTTPNWQLLPTYFNIQSDTTPYYITPIGFDSTATLRMIDQSTPYPFETLFTNQNMAAEFGQSKQVARLGNALVITPSNGAYGFDYGNTDFQRRLLLESLTLNNSLTLPAGAIIYGLGLNAYQTGDRTFDDFVFAISKTAPTVTPVPGAVWLLGSGLVGLMGFKRSRRAGK